MNLRLPNLLTIAWTWLLYLHEGLLLKEWLLRLIKMLRLWHWQVLWLRELVWDVKLLARMHNAWHDWLVLWWLLPLLRSGPVEALL